MLQSKLMEKRYREFTAPSCTAITTKAPTIAPIQITALDVALENMGAAQLLTLEDGREERHEFLTSIHVTKDGRMFEYEEKQLPRLCWEWVVAHRKYWQHNGIIYLEKQECTSNRPLERACLQIQVILESIFLTLYMQGNGPKPICISAKWWRREVGLPVGNGNREANKKESVAYYENLLGDEGKYNTRLWMQKWGKVDDIVEASLMVMAVKKNYKELIRPEFPTAHVETLTETRITSDKRLRLLPELPPASVKPEDFSIVELRRQYMDFKHRRKTGKTARQNQKLLKKNLKVRRSSQRKTKEQSDEEC